MSATIYDGNKTSEIEISCLDILVTDRCNLRCRYCFHTKTPQDLSDETMEKAISFLSPQISKRCEFNFFGGEPLLREDFCVKWMNNLKKFRPDGRLHIVTNCTVFSDNIVRIAKSEAPHFLQISYDGINQSKNRGEEELVRSNLAKYIDSIGGDKVTVRLTFTHDTVGDLYDNMIHMYERGVRRFAHHATYDNSWTDQELKEYNNQLDKMHDFLSTHPEFINVFCDCKNAIRNRGMFRCSMGRSLIALATSGDLYPCHYAVGTEKFKIGNVYSNRLNRGRFANIGMSGCSDCEAKHICHNCLMANYRFSGSLTNSLKCVCSMNKYEYEKVKERYENFNSYSSSEESILLSMICLLEDMHGSNDSLIRKIDETSPY